MRTARRAILRLFPRSEKEKRSGADMAGRKDPSLAFAFSMALLAGALQTVHGGAAGRPEFEKFRVHHGSENFFHIPGTLVGEHFKKIIEIELAFAAFSFQEIDYFLLFFGHGHSP